MASAHALDAKDVAKALADADCRENGTFKSGKEARAEPFGTVSNVASRLCDEATPGLQCAATRYNGNGSKGVDWFTMLVESRPFDPSNALGLCLRRREFDHLAFEV